MFGTPPVYCYILQKDPMKTHNKWVKSRPAATGTSKSCAFRRLLPRRWAAEVRNGIHRWSLYCFSSVILLVAPTVVYAQKIPDSVILSVGAGLLAPAIAVPVKLGIARLFGTVTRPSKLWILCLIEWLLWFPVGFIVVRIGGIGFGLFSLLAFSAWLHRAPTPMRGRFERYAIGLALALPTPVLALFLFVAVLYA